MLIRAIAAIRRKPKAVRERYAFWIAATVTAVVVVVWIYNFPVNFGEQAATAQSTTEPAPDEPSSLSEAVGGLREELGRLSELTENLTSTTTEEAATSTQWVSSTSQDTVVPETRPEVRIATITASTTNQN